MKKAQLDGFNDAKIAKFGPKFMRVIHEQLNYLPNQAQTMQDWLLIHPFANPTKITPAVETFYEQFRSGKSVEECAKARGVVTGTGVEYLNKAILGGLPFTKKDLHRAGVDDKTFAHIKSRLPKDLTEVTLRQVKDNCLPHITWDAIKLVLAYCRVRWHLDQHNCIYDDPDRAPTDAEETSKGETSKAAEPKTAEPNVNESCDADLLDDGDDDLLLEAEKSLLGLEEEDLPQPVPESVPESPVKAAGEQAKSSKILQSEIQTPEPELFDSDDDMLLKLEKEMNKDAGNTLYRAEQNFLNETQPPPATSSHPLSDPMFDSMDTPTWAAMEQLEQENEATTKMEKPTTVPEKRLDLKGDEQKPASAKSSQSEPETAAVSTSQPEENGARQKLKQRPEERREVNYVDSDSDGDSPPAKNRKVEAKGESVRVLPDWLAKKQPSNSNSTSPSTSFRFKKAKNKMF